MLGADSPDRDMWIIRYIYMILYVYQYIYIHLYILYLTIHIVHIPEADLTNGEMCTCI